MAQNNLGVLVETIFNAPLWVQEVIFVDMKKHLEEKLKGVTDATEEEIYPTYIPELSFKGKKELETHDHNHDFNIYKYLTSASQGLRVIDITLNNFWTLEESSKYLAECIKNEYIKSPANPALYAGIFYIGGEIRLGEYVKKLNMINIEQLDDVLRKQKQYNEENPQSPKKIGEMLLSMGYVANKDIDKILYIKNEAKKRFILSNDLKAPAKAENVNYEELQQKIQKLTQENNLLKDKLRAIFNIQNKKTNG
ncbi:MAG: hypothetical protein KHX03_10340 [Clostridium sp.]|nr:hypothetical protein [Clostridium sp.]